MKLKVVFSIDATGHNKDIVEIIHVDMNTCLYCLHDKNNRFIDVVMGELTSRGYDLRYYFQIMKIYVV